MWTPSLRTIQNQLFALAILLTHYSSLIFVEAFTDETHVRYWTYLIIAAQYCVCGIIFTVSDTSRFAKLLAFLFILDQLTEGIPRSNHHVILHFVSWIFLLARSPEQISNSVRVVVVTAYLLTSFHKLNHGFLDALNGCTSLFLDNALMPIFGKGSPLWIKQISPILVIAIETSIAVLLLLPRWGVAALLAAIVFHGALAVDIAKHFFDFSIVMVALVAISALPSLKASRTISERTRGYLLAGFRIVLLTTYVAIVLASWQFDLEYSIAGDLLIVGTLVALFLFGLLTFYLFAARVVAEPSVGESLNGPITWCVGLAFLFVCCGPYLGTRTRFSMDMYSGLKISANSSNHFLIGRSLDLFGYLSDWITLRSSSEPEIQALIDRGDERMPLLELRRIHDKFPGAQFNFEPMRELPPLTYIERNFMVFRPDSLDGKNQCRW